LAAACLGLARSTSELCLFVAGFFSDKGPDDDKPRLASLITSISVQSACAAAAFAV